MRLNQLCYGEEALIKTKRNLPQGKVIKSGDRRGHFGTVLSTRPVLLDDGGKWGLRVTKDQLKYLGT